MSTFLDKSMPESYTSLYQLPSLNKTTVGPPAKMVTTPGYAYLGDLVTSIAHGGIFFTEESLSLGLEALVGVHLLSKAL